MWQFGLTGVLLTSAMWGQEYRISVLAGGPPAGIIGTVIAGSVGDGGPTYSGIAVGGHGSK